MIKPKGGGLLQGSEKYNISIILFNRVRNHRTANNIPKAPSYIKKYK